MDKFELQKLRDSLNIEAVAERLGLHVSRHMCLCPFHDDHHPSMSLKGAHYRCWSCGAHGDAFDLVMKLQSLGFPAACRWLADETGVILTAPSSPGPSSSPGPPQSPLKGEELSSSPPSGATGVFTEATECGFGPTKGSDSPVATGGRWGLFFEHPTLSEAHRQWLFGERRLNPAVVRWCRLNSYGDWLQAPYYDQHMRFIGFESRYMGHDPNQPRFRFPRGQECHLYCQPVIPMLRPGEHVAIAEGLSDTWALLSSGRKTVGVPSATLLRPEDLLPLAGRCVECWPDADQAGEKLYRKLVECSLQVGFTLVRNPLPKGCKDFSEYYCSRALL